MTCDLETAPLCTLMSLSQWSLLIWPVTWRLLYSAHQCSGHNDLCSHDLWLGDSSALYINVLVTMILAHMTCDLETPPLCTLMFLSQWSLPIWPVTWRLLHFVHKCSCHNDLCTYDPWLGDSSTLYTNVLVTMIFAHMTCDLETPPLLFLSQWSLLIWPVTWRLLHSVH